MIEIFLKFLLFNLTNEEIQQKTERENLKYEYWYVKKKELKFFLKNSVILYPIIISILW